LIGLNWFVVYLSGKPELRCSAIVVEEGYGFVFSVILVVDRGGGLVFEEEKLLLLK
jgi:hypothetical protein